MGRFLNSQKIVQRNFKQAVNGFSDEALKQGIYRGHAYEHCLLIPVAEENLYAGIRHQALDYFDKYEIKWHDGGKRRPSNHMCSSQVCCVNFLFPFAGRPQALATVLSDHFPELQAMLPFNDEDGQYVIFEWIGKEDYLHEKAFPTQKRVRGALFTSADAAVQFRRKDGTIQVVLIEWKYTEAYSATPYHTGRSGAKRLATYGERYKPAVYPLNQSGYSNLTDLFYEPFYQLMRQQFLAHEMETHSEFGAQTVSVLHIAPAQNKDFEKITAPTLKQTNKTAIGVWADLVRPPDRFKSISTEALFGSLTPEQLPAMRDWLAYIRARYPWVHSSVPA